MTYMDEIESFREMYLFHRGMIAWDRYYRDWRFIYTDEVEK